jgi:hypothetical protein
VTDKAFATEAALTRPARHVLAQLSAQRSEIAQLAAAIQRIDATLQGTLRELRDLHGRLAELTDNGSAP